MKNGNGDEDLTIPVLTAPDELEANIPEDLMEGLSKRDQHTLKTLSIIAQKIDWVIRAVVEQNSYQRRLERRQNKTDRLVSMLSGKWSPFFYVGGVILTAAVSRYFIKLWP